MIRAVIFDMFETLITHYKSPLYFGAQIAADAGIPQDDFQRMWKPTEHDRTVGRATLQETLERILRANGRYSEDLLQEITAKRVAAKEACFRRLHPEIIPLLSTLKEKGILLGLISNCYSEETEVIRKSELFPYFDAVCLSYEQGIKKPDEAIFHRCMDALSVKAEECVYVGDGGSYELETAEKLGMTAVQAVWYFGEHMPKSFARKPNFRQFETPLDVLRTLDIEN